MRFLSSHGSSHSCPPPHHALCLLPERGGGQVPGPVDTSVRGDEGQSPFSRAPSLQSCPPLSLQKTPLEQEPHLFTWKTACPPPASGLETCLQERGSGGKQADCTGHGGAEALFAQPFQMEKTANSDIKGWSSENTVPFGQKGSAGGAPTSRQDVS